MRILFFTAALGVFCVSFLPYLPSPWWLTLLPAVLWLAWCRRTPATRALAGLALGLGWGTVAGHWLLTGILSPAWEREDLQLRGCISGLPAYYGEGRQYRGRFVFLVHHAHPLAAPATRLPLRRLRLSWYGPPPLQTGQCWELQVRLRAPRGFANPGGSDYGAWLLAQGIGATGYVRAPERARRLADRDWRTVHHRLRAVLARRMEGRPQGEFTGFVSALAFGDRRALAPELRRILQHSGTAHLLAISGLHVGFIALLCQLLCKLLTRLVPPCLRLMPAQCWGAAGGLLGAFCYAMLAGFSLPTRRALVMVAVVMLALLLRRRVSFAGGFCLALFLVALQDPLAPHTAGFWLSFVAVGVLLYAFQRTPDMLQQARAPRTPWRAPWRILRHFLYAQLAVSLGLVLPLGLFLHGVPLLSVPANLFAIPWVSLLVAPAALAGTLGLAVSPLGEYGVRLAEWGLAVLFAVLHGMMELLELPVWHPPRWPVLSMIAAIAGTLLLLRARHLYIAAAGLALLLPLTWSGGNAPAAGALQVLVLDVGQGLSVLLRTRNHGLLYDTGPVMGQTDAARLAVLPTLRSLGVRSLDVLVLSHGDLDHVGGTVSVLEELPVDTIFSGEPWRSQEDLAPGIRRQLETAEPCRAGQHWRWDGVDFRILHPPESFATRNANDLSCVLLVEVGGRRVLLPGDISRRVERRLAGTWSGAPVSVLLASHHGSNSSSAMDWIAALRPRHVVYSSGHLNHFSHPHPAVVRRYLRAGASGIHTGRSGAVQFLIDANGTVQGPGLYRTRHRRYWHRP